MTGNDERVPKERESGKPDHLKLPLDEWVGERLANCERIATMKTGADRDGWLEDAAYFRALLAALEAAEARVAELEIVGRRFYDAVLAVSEPALRNENEPPKETLDRLTDTAREFKAILTPGTER